jgi:hypothetical protein
MEHRAVREEIDAYLRSPRSERVEGLMPFISYAQNYEDVILWRAMRDIEHGFYVDIGAADRGEDSVTKILAEWSNGPKVAGLEQELGGMRTTRQARRSIGSGTGTDC